MSVPQTGGRKGFSGLVERLVRLWALFGGAILLFLVAVNVFEVITTATRPLTGYRFSGAVEITELAAAAAAFCFLPWCQLTDANVTADIFTARAGPRTIAVLKLAAAVVAILFGGLLLRQMSLGAIDHRGYGYTTAVLDIPEWWAFVPMVISLALLVLAAIVTLIEQARYAATGEDN